MQKCYVLFSFPHQQHNRVMMEVYLTDRHSRGSCHQRHVGSHRGTAGHPQLLRQLSLPLQTSGPAVVLGARGPAERHRAWGGADTPPRAPQADVAGLRVLHRVTQGETQAQMWSQPPWKKGTGHLEGSACDMWAQFWHISLSLLPQFNLKSYYYFCSFLCFLVSPKDVMVQVQSLMVQEGGSALLVCTCKADPPASEYRWSYTQHGRTVHLHQRTHSIRVYNVTRDMRVRCTAQNLIGRGESRPTPLNIQCNPASCRLASNDLTPCLECLTKSFTGLCLILKCQLCFSCRVLCHISNYTQQWRHS